MKYKIKEIYPNVLCFWMRETDDNPNFDKEQYCRELSEMEVPYDDRFDDIKEDF